MVIFFNFVNFEKCIYMKLYCILIINKNAQIFFKNTKHLKILNYLYFLDLCCHVSKIVCSIQYFRPHIPTISDGMISIAAALIWSGKAMISGGSPTALMVCATLGRRHQYVARCCANIQLSFWSTHCKFGFFLNYFTYC